MSLPAQPFFTTREQRTALARQRYFDEGQRPSGLVGEQVIQSWSRCRLARRDPGEVVAFDPVTPSRLHAALSRSRGLLEAAAHEFDQLEATLAGTGCRALLTDRHGVVVSVTRPDDSAARGVLLIAARPGVNLSEAAVGSTAPGIVAHTGRACTVLAGEHYFDAVTQMHCAAAPIRDIHGRLAGILDLSAEARPFGFDAGSLVAMAATAIENRLLRLQARFQLVLEFQAGPVFLGTPLVALAGVDDDGQVAWLNAEAQRLTGHAPDRPQAEAVFGLDLPRLLALTTRRDPAALRLPNGLRVWMLARLHGQGDPDVQSQPPDLTPAPPPEPTGSPSLAAHSRDHIAHVLAECQGNIALAARRLGVSRGLIYRRLQAREPGCPQ
jgi:transcriptional regulator of acetoin/glycerol metabolism